MKSESYLNFTDYETSTLNEKGLGKLLLIRRETIFVRNAMRLASKRHSDMEVWLSKIDATWADYILLMSKRLGRILKGKREVQGVANAHDSWVLRQADAIELVNKLQIPFLACIDFDRTLTNDNFRIWFKKFHSETCSYGQFWICSAHGKKEVIKNYIKKHNIPLRDSRILAERGVPNKFKALFQLSRENTYSMLLLFDDEIEVCEYGLFIGYHSYNVHKGNDSIFKRVGFE